MKLDPSIHIAMYSVLSLKPGVTGLQRVYLTSVLSSALVKEYICRLYILLSIFYSALGKECARNFALVKTPSTRQTGGFS